MIGLDAFACELERVDGLGVASADGTVDIPRRHPQAHRLEIDMIEFLRQRDQRAVTVFHDVGDDRAHHPFDILGDFALGGEKGAEPISKVGATGIEADRHTGS